MVSSHGKVEPENLSWWSFKVRRRFPPALRHVNPHPVPVIKTTFSGTRSLFRAHANTSLRALQLDSRDHASILGSAARAWPPRRRTGAARVIRVAGRRRMDALPGAVVSAFLGRAAARGRPSGEVEGGDEAVVQDERAGSERRAVSVGVRTRCSAAR